MQITVNQLFIEVSPLLLLIISDLGGDTSVSLDSEPIAR